MEKCVMAVPCAFALRPSPRKEASQGCGQVFILLRDRQNLPTYLWVVRGLGPGAQARGFPPVAVGALLSGFHAVATPAGRVCSSTAPAIVRRPLSPSP